jgi:hypothetical protein
MLEYYYRTGMEAWFFEDSPLYARRFWNECEWYIVKSDRPAVMAFDPAHPVHAGPFPTEAAAKTALMMLI